ncbi:hypothetical protein Neosp_012622 [[Neocosmospora] mangrovei]
MSVLLENVPTDPAAHIDTDNLSEEQLRKLRSGMANAVTHPEVDEMMHSDIRDTAKSTATIKRIFTELLTAVGEMDAKYVAPGQPTFASRLLAIKHKFDEHISSSAEMAVKISLNASRFAQILPYVNDSPYAEDIRKKMLEDFIKDAENVGTYASAVVVTLTQLNNDMAQFVSSFASWAVDKEKADRAEVVEIDKQITALKDKIAKLRTAQITTGVAAAVSLPAAAHKKDLKQLEDRRNTLQKDADDIKTTREKAQETGRKDLSEFGTAIGNLSTVWQTCKNDAQACKTWLDTMGKEVSVTKRSMGAFD